MIIDLPTPQQYIADYELRSILKLLEIFGAVLRLFGAVLRLFGVVLRGWFTALAYGFGNAIGFVPDGTDPNIFEGEAL